MPKINVMLDDESHEVLTVFKKTHKHPNLDEALIGLLKDYKKKSRLVRLAQT
jgi:hypothetical protein